MGMIIGFNLIMAVFAFIVFMTTLKKTKYVSLASTSVPISFLLITIVYGIFGWNVHSVVPNAFAAIPYIIAIGFIIVFRHQQNYNNIKNGVEPKTKWLLYKQKVRNSHFFYLI